MADIVPVGSVVDQDGREIGVYADSGCVRLDVPGADRMFLPHGVPELLCAIVKTAEIVAARQIEAADDE